MRCFRIFADNANRLNQLNMLLLHHFFFHAQSPLNIYSFITILYIVIRNYAAAIIILQSENIEKGAIYERT